MQQWLLTGTCPGLEKANRAVQEERNIAIRETQVKGVYYSREASELNSEDEGKIHLKRPKAAVVESNHRGGIGIGYCIAPIVFAKTEAFQFNSGAVGRKYTIAQHDEGYFDMEGFLAELKEHDPNAGGSRVIVGTDQSKPSELELDLIVSIAEKYVSASAV